MGDATVTPPLRNVIEGIIAADRVSRGSLPAVDVADRIIDAVRLDILNDRTSLLVARQALIDIANALEALQGSVYDAINDADAAALLILEADRG